MGKNFGVREKDPREHFMININALKPIMKQIRFILKKLKINMLI